MEIIKTAGQYTIVKKRSGRFGVKDQRGRWVNGDEKVKVLLAEGLIKVTEPKKEEPAAEESAEETSADAAAQEGEATQEEAQG